MKFDYLIDKIAAADFSTVPFKHLYIRDLFSPEHLQEIIGSPEINIAPAANDQQLFDHLFANGYKIIDFPGCVVDKDQYISWHKDRKVEHITNTSCEGYGMTLRLTTPKTPVISELHEFLVGDRFREGIAKKFGIDLDAVFPDSGIQKYLDGYEISPHPDIRKKALTYMVNINPHEDSPQHDHHTHYLNLKSQYKYVQAFWEGNPKKDRCWVPWDWCETITQQRENNSIVIFSPSNDTVHGVKTDYNHLKAQRTQLYGNLWYHECALEGMPNWEDYVVGRSQQSEPATLVGALKAALPKKAKDAVRKIFPDKRAAADANIIRDRLAR